MKKGQKRKKKDPNAPKRPTSAYFYYVQECREIAKKEGRVTKKVSWLTILSLWYVQLNFITHNFGLLLCPSGRPNVGFA